MIDVILKLGRWLNAAHIAPYVFVAPFVITFAVFFFYPLVSTVLMSFQEIVPGSAQFIGWKNYGELMNGSFLTAVRNTAVFTLFSVLLLTVLPIVLAVLMHVVIRRFRELFKLSLFLPVMVSTVVGGVIFRQLFGQLETSFVNAILIQFGLPAQEWTMNAGTGMFLMVALAAWRWTGINMLYFLAGLQNIPADLYEAAEIDGANWLKKFFYITLPALRAVCIFVLIISISAGFKMFEESYVFWQGNSPKDIGLTIVGYMYREGIAMGNMGLGSAAGIVLLLIILIVSVIQLKYFGLYGKEDQA